MRTLKFVSATAVVSVAVAIVGYVATSLHRESALLTSFAGATSISTEIASAGEEPASVADQELPLLNEEAQGLEDTPDNRKRVADTINAFLADRAVEHGIAPNQAPTFNDLVRDYYNEWVKEKPPQQSVADMLRLERKARLEASKEGRQAPTTNYSAALLLPYMVAAGLCEGDVMSAQGQTCGLIDRSPGAPRVKGDIGGIQAMKEPPMDSELAQILAMSRQDEPITTARAEKAMAEAKKVLAALGNAIVPIAHADYPVGLPTDGTTVPTVDEPFNIDTCVLRDYVDSATTVIKLDPWAFGLLLFDQILSRVEVSGSGYIGATGASKTQAAVKIATNSAVAFLEKGVNEQLNEALASKSNRVADKQAKEMCRGRSGADYERCYADKYRTRVQIGEQLALPLNMLTGYVKYKAIETEAQAKKGGFPFWGTLAKKAIPKAINVNIYGENYTLATLAYATT